MTTLPDAWRQTHATTDAKRAKSKVLRTCLTCPAKISGGKKYCLPCYDIRSQERIAANRPKYKGRKYGKQKL